MTATSINETAIRETLRQVVDPELGCNIVDLGLIYGITIDSTRVTVTMTLTTPGCPMHESITWGVKRALLNLEGIEEADVQVVWDPPWTPARMTDNARKQLGVSERADGSAGPQSYPNFGGIVTTSPRVL